MIFINYNYIYSYFNIIVNYILIMNIPIMNITVNKEIIYN